MTDAEVKQEFDALVARYIDQGHPTDSAERMAGRHYLPGRPNALRNEMLKRQNARYSGDPVLPAPAAVM